MLLRVEWPGGYKSRMALAVHNRVLARPRLCVLPCLVGPSGTAFRGEALPREVARVVVHTAGPSSSRSPAYWGDGASGL